VGFEKTFFNIFGNRFKVTDKGDHTEITWIRFAIVWLILWVMTLIWGIASAAGLEEIMDMKIFAMNTTATIIFWSIWCLLGIHIFFNQKSVVTINSHEFRFKKRPFSPITRKHAIQNIIRIDLKLRKNYHESDIGHYPDIYKSYICLKQEKRIKLDSFNKEDAEEIRNAFQQYMS
jgi:hypothetical protein